MNKFLELKKITGIQYAEEPIILQAFVHRSFLNESKEHPQSNERLEFLGDSVLSYVTSGYLYKKYPTLPEGELTNLRSSIVKTTTLAEISEEMKLGDYLLLSRGEEEGGGRRNPSLLADTFEALLGATYLVFGLDKVEIILEKFLFPKLEKIIEDHSYKDHKSLFQELVQEETRTSPLYKVLKEEGPDHSKEFTIGVYVENILWGSGTGKSKQEAEQGAAKTALEKWQNK